jgi:predicted HicB family RNase H-like nuclease
MNTMTYKGYTARIDFDDRDDILVGRLLGIRDIVSFHADNVTELRTAFEEAVDDYLEACARLGKAPEKPASGKLMLRVPPEVHSAALVAAQAAGTSLNQWAAKVLAQAAHAG